MTSRQIPTKRAFAWSAAVIVTAVVVAGIAAAANSAKSPREIQQMPVVPVDFVTADPVSQYDDIRSYAGTIEAARVSELGFARAGRLVKIFVEEGDDVYQGKLLAQLDVSHLEARREELQAQRAQAVAQLDEFLAGPRKETIAAARADVAEVQSQYDLASAGHRRSEDLFARKVISKDDYDQSDYGVRAAQARLDSAQRKLDELLAGTRKEQIAAQRAAVSQLDAALKDLEVDIDDAHLTAPYDGRIARRYVDEGTYVSPSSPTIRYVEHGNLEARIGLPVDIARTLSVGSRHELSIGERRYPATVKLVLPELNMTTRTRTVVFALESQAAQSVVPGEVVRVEIAETVNASGYWLPTAALSRGSRGLWSVLVVANDAGTPTEVAKRRDVEVLHTQEERVLVRGTLQPGDRVIAGGTHRVVEGQAVRGRPL